MTVLLALLSASSNAVSTVLQRIAAATAPPSTAMRLSLLGYLLHRRVWVAGLAAMVASFLLQAAALDGGTLAVVQPLLIAKLPITVLLAMGLFRGRVRMRAADWLALIAMSGGLGLALGVAAPEGSSASPSSAAWLLTVVGTGIVVAVLVAFARLHPGPARAALLGAASGLAFGLIAALIKGVTETLDGGVGGLLLSWFPYATAVVGLVAVLLQQSALQAGSLVASQPASTIVGTLASVLMGVGVFGERIRVDGVWPLELLGIGLVVAAVFVTAHSPLVTATVAAGTSAEIGGRTGDAAPTVATL